MIILLSLIGLLSVTTVLFTRQSKFGKAPSGARLEAFKKSPHFKNGKFQNLSHTPQLTEGHHMTGVLVEFLFKKKERRRPAGLIPSVKTDLIHLNIKEDVLVWFGHSSYFIQLDSKRILVDPVFSGNASPIQGSNKAFNGADRYSSEDMPEIDYLLITHDHWDHLDHTTLVELIPKVKQVICGLGVGSHLEYWGYAAEKIIERDWYEEIVLNDDFVIHTAPARHFSGRAFSRNNTLWLSYVLKSPTMKIYIGGDSGYDVHYKAIGEKHGPFDLVILENGQYDKTWKYIHHMPEEVLQAAVDLQAKRLLPVHSGKFVMANHPWDEPLIRITEANKNAVHSIPLVTPVIGEKVFLKEANQIFREWWEEVG